MYCKYCGKAIADDSVFCPCCGSKLVLPMAPQNNNQPLPSQHQTQEPTMQQQTRIQSPLPQEQKKKVVSDKWLWTLAIAPIVSGWVASLTSYFLQMMGITIPFMAIVVSIIINCVFLTLDVKELKRSGINPNAWLFLGVVLVPVYLFVRSSKTNRNWGPGIVYCVLFSIDICGGILLGSLGNILAQY